MKKYLLIVTILFLCFQLKAQQPQVLLQSTHKDVVMSLTFTPDGNYLITASEDRTIKFWDAHSGFQVDSIRLKNRVRQVVVSPDGKQLFVSTSNRPLIVNTFIDSDSKGEFIVFDLKTKKQLFIYDNIPAITRIKCSSDGSLVAVIDVNQKLRLFQVDMNCFLGEISASNVYVSDADFSPDLKFIAICGKDDSEYGIAGQVSIYSLKNKSEPKLKKTIPVKSGAICYTNDGKYLIYGTTLGYIDVVDAQSLKPVSNIRFNDNNHTSLVNRLTITPNNKYLISGSTDETIKVWDIATGKNLRTFVGHQKRITSLSVSPDSKYIATSAMENNFKYWDIETGEEEDLFALQASSVYSVDVSQDQKYFAEGSDDKTVKLFDYEKGNLIKTLKGHNYKVELLTFSPNGKFILSASNGKVNDNFVSDAILWNVQTGKTEWQMSFSSSVYSVSFSPDGKKFIVSSTNTIIGNTSNFTTSNFWELVGFSPVFAQIRWMKDSKHVIVANNASSPNLRLRIANTEKRDDYHNIEDGGEGSPDELAISPDGNFMAVYYSISRRIYIYDVQHETVLKVIPKDYFDSKITFSPDSKTLAVEDYNSIHFWDISSGSFTKTIKPHDILINGLKFSSDGKYILTVSDDGTIKKTNLSSGEWIAYIGDEKGMEWIMFNSDGYWDSSTRIGNFLTMKIGSEICGIDQFAPWTNRPDKILEKFGSNDFNLIKYYKSLYLKRIRKLGLNENSQFNDIDIPVSKINSINQEGNKVTLDLTFSSFKTELTSYYVFVNDVPIFGTNGKPFSNRIYNVVESITLTEGKNKIEVSCKNILGIESFRVMTAAKSTIRMPKDLYILAFGVSKYQNSLYNLQFAAKDALDLEKVIQSYKGKGFDNVYSKVLTNEQVTPETIKASKDFVKSAKPDDTFILFIAGHGMHDKDAEATYYYLTSNADINNLKATAADFETIEDLLQGIPPRNKLFLMDACESGEIDEETYENLSGFQNLKGLGIASRGFKTTSSPSTVNSQPSTKRSYLYQKDRYIYNDLVRRSGAIVFSSSKGGELSYERSDIENGLFTEYIMKALTTTEADKDGNGIVSTDELREYVSAQVAKASGDLQHPTVDRDNIYQKFGFTLR